MPYPQTDKPHRRSRRRLGRGQFNSASPVHTLVTGSNSTATITFESPVVIRGLIDLAIATVSPLAQTINSATSVAILYNGPITGLAYTLPGPPSNVASVTGGPVLGLTGRIAPLVPITANNIIVADGAGGFLGGRGILDPSGSLTMIAGQTFTLANGVMEIQNAAVRLGFGGIVWGSGHTLQTGNATGIWTFQAAVVFDAEITLGQFTVALLPAAADAVVAYATDGCKVGEAPGTGTGVPVYASLGVWLVFSTDQPVTA